jgi:hypothetical protein
MNFSVFRAQNIDELLFLLGWDRYGFNKMRIRTRYIGMDSTKSVPRHITSNLCFCIRWDLQVT